MDDQTLGTIEPGDRGDPEVERRLEAFADARLLPNVAATTRIRAAVMTAAHRRAELIEADAASGLRPASAGSAPAGPASAERGSA